MKASRLPAWFLLLGATAFAQAKPGQLEVDHLMIHVAAGAPERAAFERAGFRIARAVNRHDGQGSASVTMEFANGFLELTWRDTSVSVAEGMDVVAHRFAEQSAWRTSGWSPFGVGLRRAADAPDSLPFPTRPVRAQWMRPGASIELINAVSDSLGPRLWVVPRMMAANGDPAEASERDRLSHTDDFAHPNGARRITAVTVAAPVNRLSSQTRALGATGVATFEPAGEWLMTVTFDGGARREMRDLRPELPLVVRW
jgi:hypothetical protein